MTASLINPNSMQWLVAPTMSATRAKIPFLEVLSIASASNRPKRQSQRKTSIACRAYLNALVTARKSALRTIMIKVSSGSACIAARKPLTFVIWARCTCARNASRSQSYNASSTLCAEGGRTAHLACRIQELEA